MTHGPPMALPPGRALLGWWRELAGLRPRRMYFAHLAVHRLEVLVEAGAARPLAALAAALRRLEGVRAEELAVDRAVLAAARRDRPPAEEGRRRVTFWFTDSPALYLPLAAEVTTPLEAPAGWRFDLAALEACVARPGEWKARHGFPADVRRVVREGGSGEWRHVALDRAEQVMLCLAMRGDGSVVGHAVRGDSWELVQPAALAVAAGEELFGPFMGEIGADALRAAWQAWCQRRSLPGGEVEACALELAGGRLVARAPAKLVERLKAARSEALRGEAWVLLGSGRVRQAAQVEVVG